MKRRYIMCGEQSSKQDQIKTTTTMPTIAQQEHCIADRFHHTFWTLKRWTRHTMASNIKKICNKKCFTYFVRCIPFVFLFGLFFGTMKFLYFREEKKMFFNVVHSCVEIIFTFRVHFPSILACIEWIQHFFFAR